MQNTVSTQFGVYLISFRAITNHFIFDGNTPELLGNLIQLHGQHGINFIKRYNQAKEKFERLSKAEITNLFNWDTHSIIELQKTNFIK